MRRSPVGRVGAGGCDEASKCDLCHCANGPTAHPSDAFPRDVAAEERIATLRRIRRRVGHRIGDDALISKQRCCGAGTHSPQCPIARRGEESTTIGRSSNSSLRGAQPNVAAEQHSRALLPLTRGAKRRAQKAIERRKGGHIGPIRMEQQRPQNG